MKLIYLDYDGVLVNSLSIAMAKQIAKLDGQPIPRGTDSAVYDINVVRALFLLQVKNQNLRYVCSSVAHAKATKDEQEATFKELGFPLIFHENHKTKRLLHEDVEQLKRKHPTYSFGETTTNRFRGMEIFQHLTEIGVSPKSTDYVMLDDDLDYLPLPKENFLRCKGGMLGNGLNITNLMMLKKILELN